MDWVKREYGLGKAEESGDGVKRGYWDWVKVRVWIGNREYGSGLKREWRIWIGF